MSEKLRRIQFNDLLLSLMPDGKKNVYFQPGPNTTIQYPAIVYERDDTEEKFADNVLYKFKQRYQVTYLDHDPDGESDVLDKLRSLPFSSFSRRYAVLGLNHDVYAIYY